MLERRFLFILSLSKIIFNIENGTSSKNPDTIRILLFYYVWSTRVARMNEIAFAVPYLSKRKFFYGVTKLAK